MTRSARQTRSGCPESYTSGGNAAPGAGDYTTPSAALSPSMAAIWRLASSRQ